MKVNLLVLVLAIIGLGSAFRVLRKDTLDLGQVPDSISYLAPNLLVVQTDTNISIYNTETHQIQQTYQSDEESPDVQVNPQTGLVLFKSNRSIFQLQKSNTPTSREFPTSGTHWVYGLGSSNNTVMVHQLSNDGTERVLRYLHTDSSAISTFIEADSNNNTVVAGSRVVALSDEEYYFVSGGICHNQQEQSFYYLYKGNSKGINNFFNLSVPNCVYTLVPDHKQEWELSTINTGNNNRLHAVTYVLDQLHQPRIFTTQVLTSNSDFTSELTRFDTKRLIGVDFLSGNLYTADDLLCRVVKHTPDNYNSAEVSEGVLDFDMTSSVVSEDQSMVLALTGTDTNYLLTIASNNSYTIDQTLNTPTGQSITQAFFSNSSLLVLLDASSNLSIYNTADQGWSQTGWSGVEDFCVTDSSMMFSVSQVNAKYVLTVSQVVSNGDGYEIQEINSLTLNWTFSDVMCLDSNSVLINPATPGQPIAIWKYNNAFVNTANLIKLQTKHNKAYTTGSAIFFTNPDKHSTPLFYDYSLIPIVLTTGLHLSPTATYSFLQPTSEYILFGVGYEDSEYVSIDQYQLFSDSLMYMGTYPLVNYGIATLSKVIILPTSEKISIQYPSAGNSLRTLTYELSSPPQELRGHFYSAGQNECAGYSDAVFRLNPNNNDLQMVVVNGIQDTPALQKFVFSENTNDLTLQSQVTLNKFLFTKLSTELSEDRQSILIYGIKQSSTLLDTIQIRNANNIDDVTFENAYFAETDPRDLQAYTLVGTDVYTSIINSPSSKQHQSIVQNTPTSGGKISTGSIGDISFFATCGSCNFLSAVTSNDPSKILLINIKSGLVKSTISTPCEVQMMALVYDGIKLAYLCTNTNLYTYDIASDKTVLQGTNYSGVTSMRLLSSTSLVIVKGSTVSNIALRLSSTEKVSQHPKDVRFKLKATNNSAMVTLNNNQGIYAFKATPQTVQIDSFNGSSLQNFTLKSGEQITGLAFSPDNNLTITTNSSSLYVLTTQPCQGNYTEQEGICTCGSTFVQDGSNCYCGSYMTLTGDKCTCNPTFMQDASNCQCAQSMTVIEDKCTCNDGLYYIDETGCGDCSWLCSTCSASGNSNCNSYSAGFYVLVIGCSLLVIGIGVFVFLKIKNKKPKMSSIRTKSQSKQQSSDLLVQEPLIKEKEYS